MKWLLALALLVASPAYAQLVFTATPPTNLQPLQGATLKGSVHIRLTQTTGGPCDFSIDGIAHKRELGAPYVFSNEAGNQADNVLWNTATVPDGSHTIIAQCASPAAPVVATFTIDNVPDVPPPVVQPPTSEVPNQIRVTWGPPAADALVAVTGYIVNYGSTPAAGDHSVDVADASASSYIIKNLEPGTYYVAVRTVATQLSTPPVSGLYSIPAPSPSLPVVVSAAPPPPVDCKVGDWVSGTPGPWVPTVCATGTQTHQVPQSRTITTAPANGGLACPELTQSLTESQPCTIPAPVDVCKADPLTAKVTAWQGGTSGARSLSYTTNKSIVGLTEIMVPPKVTFTDGRGCSVSVTR